MAATISQPAGRSDLDVYLAAIRTLAATGQEFTSDDLRPLLPAGSKVTGTAFSVARRRGLIEACGYRQSITPSRHASVVRIWRGTAETIGRPA
jgi:hypothetical protein